MKKLGADHVLNYNEDENWGETARKLTGGVGVDIVIEVGGAGTLPQSLKAIKYEGTIAIIGFLGGTKAQPSIIECLTHICTARGVYVGSRQQMEDMVSAIEANDIHPVLDAKVFTLEQAKEAYEYQVSRPPQLICCTTRLLTWWWRSGQRRMSGKYRSRLHKPDTFPRLV